MGLFDGFKNSIGGGIGGVFGGIAGNVAGLPGMFLGGKYGNLTGNKLQGMAGLGGDQYQGDMSGQMGYPTYIGMDPNQMEIGNQFMGNAPLDKYAGESMRNGPSQGTQFALRQNTLGANNQREQARKMAGGMAGDARAALSMKGGLGAGASERIGKQAGNAALDFSNAADANASSNRANLLIADEGARNANLQGAAGLIGGQNQSRYNMMAGDLARKQGEYDRRNQYNMNNYNQQMAAWGAGKQADATAHSGKKG